MLNAKGERELAYVVRIDGIEPIPGYDRVETAVIGGWHVIVKKGDFQVGDPAIYFEIDSKVPSDRECFAFLEKRGYKIKTLRMCKTISQGLAMHPSDFGWEGFPEANTDAPCVKDDEGKFHYADSEDRFLTKKLGVTYADTEDNQRKAPSVDKYKKMAQRMPHLFKTPVARWMMRRHWGRKVMFFFFGKKRDKKSGWPQWVQKTDEERIENMPWILEDNTRVWIATEKIDGTSTTFTLKRGSLFHKEEFYICSRNVVFDKPNKQCYYDTNVYTEMAEKYHIYEKMKKMLNEEFKNCEWITIQGETYGPKVQNRDYHAPERGFMAFNFITSSSGRWNSIDMKNLLEKQYGIPCVPILGKMTLPATVQELRDYVNSATSMLDNDMREGVVFRGLDGTRSFKCVSPEYLMKYHG